MNIRTSALALAIATTLGMSGVYAQSSTQGDATPPSSSTPGADQSLQQNSPANSGTSDSTAATSGTTSLDDQKIDQFANAYAEVATIQRNANAQLQTANEPGQAEEVKANAESQMIAAVERNGMDVNEFNQIVTAMASDENVRSRVAAKLQQRSGGGAESPAGGPTPAE
jgi:hypothetical protein